MGVGGHDAGERRGVQCALGPGSDRLPRPSVSKSLWGGWGFAWMVATSISRHKTKPWLTPLFVAISVGESRRGTLDVFSLSANLLCFPVSEHFHLGSSIAITHGTQKAGLWQFVVVPLWNVN